MGVLDIKKEVSDLSPISLTPDFCYSLLMEGK